MTAEQKAKELIEMFKPAAAQYVVDFNKMGYFGGYKVDEKETYNAAKACASICVQEMIDLLSGWPEPRDTTIQSELNFYTDVLNTINKEK